MKARLLSVVRKTCVNDKGKVIIPAFSADRTQELVYALDQLERAKVSYPESGLSKQPAVGKSYGGDEKPRNKPCIIISSSGMTEAVRIKHHLKDNIEDTRNIVLIVGYYSPNSLGFAINAAGTKSVFLEVFAR